MVKIKAESRKWAREIRKHLDITSISDLICQKIIKQDFYKNCKNIMAYYPTNNEVDILQLLKNTDKNWFLPVCDLETKTMNAYQYKFGDDLIKNNLKIKEPAKNMATINPNDIDVILVPALAGDINGHRIGYGAGYYDRFLSNIDTKTKTVMCLPDCLLVDSIQFDDWDKKVDYIITEHRVLNIL